MSKRLLVIDTATSACSAALFEDRRLIANDYADIGRGHAEKLIPMIAELPDKGRADSITVNCGPGSFTGVRIGLSAAKALALAWQAELTGFPCLNLIAAQALAHSAKPQGVYAVMIGGHGEYFVQNFDAVGAPVDILQSMKPEQAAANAKTDHFAGSAAEQLANLSKNVSVLPMLPDAKNIFSLGEIHRQAEPKPIYGRAPDAVPTAGL